MRQNWNADDEFNYYRVTAEGLRQHALRQVAYERLAFLPGLQTAHSMGILDTARLRNARVLDLGAGECLLSQALLFAAPSAEVIAVDAVPKQIWAPAWQRRSQAGLRFIVADAADLPFDAASFDLVVAHLVLHHLKPLAPVLREILRVLRPGGHMVAMEPMPLAGLLGHEVTSKNEAPVAPRALLTEFSSAGFVDATLTYWWERLRTSALGPLSPGYRVVAVSPVESRTSSLRLKRSIEPMKLPGLEIDGGYSHMAAALSQEREIFSLIDQISDVDGFRPFANLAGRR